MKKRKFKRVAKKGGLLFGVIFSFISFFLSSIVTSLVISLFENPISKIELGSLVTLLISGALSAFINAKYKGEGGTLYALLSALIASAAIFATGMILSGGNGTASLLMNVLCYLLVSALFAKLAGIKRKNGRRKH